MTDPTAMVSIFHFLTALLSPYLVMEKTSGTDCLEEFPVKELFIEVECHPSIVDLSKGMCVRAGCVSTWDRSGHGSAASRRIAVTSVERRHRTVSRNGICDHRCRRIYDRSATVPYLGR